MRLGMPTAGAPCEIAQSDPYACGADLGHVSLDVALQGLSCYTSQGCQTAGHIPKAKCLPLWPVNASPGI